MTQKDKELLLKDLSARLPYGVKVKISNEHLNDDLIMLGYWQTLDVYCITYDAEPNASLIKDFEVLPYYIPLKFIKPYLFPMSSMTKEQKEEMKSFDPFKTEEIKTLGQWAVHLVDFYNKYHFDYRGLIEKGLAIDATGLNIY